MRSRDAARGSSAVRTPSPNTVSEKTVRKSIPAGSSRYCGAAWYQTSADVSICPQDGVGGLTPTPRKESAASAEMLDGKSSAAYVMTGAASEGSSSRRAICHWFQPLSRAAATWSSDLRLSVAARTIFAVPPQPMRPMTSATSTGRGKVSGTMASRASESTISGIATTTSVIRLRTLSTSLLPRPAATPKATPSSTCTRVAANATESEIRAP